MTLGDLPEIVGADEWLTARKELLAREKELTRARDRLNADRRRLPMTRIEKPYRFEGPDGPASLLDLFEGRLQLVIHHFMWLFDLDDDGNEVPRDDTCTSCSSAADCIPPRLTQLHVRNTTLAAVSRAPLANIEAYRARMGWTFPWYSSDGSDFNYDFHATVDERVSPVMLDFRTQDELAEAGKPWDGWRGDWPGVSCFLRVDDEVYLTYSTFGRGVDLLGAPPGLLGGYLDLTALGRQEDWEEPAGRATPLGLQAGGPNLRLPDEYTEAQLSGSARPPSSSGT